MIFVPFWSAGLGGVRCTLPRSVVADSIYIFTNAGAGQLRTTVLPAGRGRGAPDVLLAMQGPPLFGGKGALEDDHRVQVHPCTGIVLIIIITNNAPPRSHQAPPRSHQGTT